MKIVMLGDSWGEPNWRSPQPGFTDQGHVSVLLRRWGAEVNNYSISGGSNYSTWWSWNTHGQHLEWPDWIIWFHTDMTRDFNWPHLHGIDRRQPWHYEQVLETTAKSVYGRCSQIWHRLGRAPLIVIEGQSTRVQPWFDQYFQPNWVIEDWRAQLIGRPLPPTQMIGPMVSQGKNFFENCLDSTAQQLMWIDQVDEIMQAMRTSDLFPDNCHPGDRAQELLVDRLIKYFYANPI
jgi:hypothetical protein